MKIVFQDSGHIKTVQIQRPLKDPACSTRLPVTMPTAVTYPTPIHLPDHKMLH